MDEFSASAARVVRHPVLVPILEAIQARVIG
jgi:hypothetical protein